MKRTPLTRKTPLRSRSPLAPSGRISRKEPIARRTRVRTRNVKRHERNWKRAYHSPERVAWVQAQPCTVTGEPGPCVNAHTFTGGTGLKAEYTTIIPVLDSVHRAAHNKGWAFVLGCTPKAVRLLLSVHAAEIQAKWLAYAEREGLDS